MLLRKETVPSPHGYQLVTDDYGGRIERDVLTCGHCQFTWAVVPGSGRRRGFCRGCARVLCGSARCMDGCRPWESMIEAMEHR